MAEKVRWGLLAAGAIAKAFAKGVQNSQTAELLAVGSRSKDKADVFGDEYGIPRRYGSYEELLADPDVDAVYVSTPHPMHAEWTIKAAEAGKHVLVEKPIGLHQYEAQAMLNAAVENNVFLMEAFMYRCNPQTAKLVELIKDGAIGDVRVIKATFSFHAGPNVDSRVWCNALGGGGILDVGCYPVSMSRLIAGAALGKDFADPVAVTGAGALHPETGVDAWAVGTMKFAGDIVASIATGVGVSQENAVRIFGSDGSIHVPDPWVCARDGQAPGKIIVNRRGSGTEEIDIPCPVTSFCLEADVASHAILAGKQEPDAPAMTWNDSMGNIRALDAWRAAVGVVYDIERPEKNLHTVTRRPLKVRDGSVMEYGKIKHLDKPMSRLVMGVDNQNSMPHLASVFDDYFERGGNAFDTSWVYGRLRSELLGQWIRNRGIREDIVLFSKGAHTPQCFPDFLSAQIIEQLEWFGTDYADIYMMHRDNPDVPVDEFIDVLNEHVQAGRIKAFGGSNWAIERVVAANTYAEKNGLQGFSVVSNNLALAEMVDAVWAGCIHAHDSKSRKWFEDTQMPLLPWSSQARCFFLPELAHPDKQNDASLVRCWYSDNNFKRQARAVELAAKYGVEPINIALAWVLCQPFPVFPLIGPRTIAETRSSFRALTVKLTPDEMAYLNLED